MICSRLGLAAVLATGCFFALAVAASDSPAGATADDGAVTLAGARAAGMVFDPRAYPDKVAGELTQVLVLGMPHLSGAPEDFDPMVLEPLLQRLEAFAPDVVAIENLSGKSLFTLQAYEAIYPGVAFMFGDLFLRMAGEARTHAEIEDLPAAEAAARAALAELGDDPTPAQRRRLALLFLAAAEPNSALVQWWRLPEAERKADADFPEPIRDALERFAARKNESGMIAARVAARRGLERVHAMDDHSAVDVVMPVFVILAAALQADPEIADRLGHPDFTHLTDALDRMTSPEEAMTTIRELNSAAAGVVDAYSQWLVMLDREFPQAAGRVRMAEWEARNLRMAALIRKASASAPGGRVLVVTGSAHKPWLDAYLGMMTDMRVVDAEVVLR